MAYQEVQRPNKWFVLLFLIPILIMLFAAFQSGIFHFSNEKGLVIHNEALETSSFYLMLAVLMILPIFFFALKLETKIDGAGIHYQFKPFHFRIKTIPWVNINKCFVRTFKPIREYGGWGIRYSHKGRAYTMNGKVGLQIELKNGKPILIGTSQKEQLEKYLRQRK